MKKLLPRIIFLVLLLAAAYLAYQQFSGSTNGAFVPYEKTELQE